jgi:hypothetical protein
MVEGCIDVFVKLTELFPKLAELFLFTGRKTISGPGNTEYYTLLARKRWQHLRVHTADNFSLRFSHIPQAGPLRTLRMC